MSGTTKHREKDLDQIIEETRQSWHQLRGHLTRAAGEGVTR